MAVRVRNQIIDVRVGCYQKRWSIEVLFSALKKRGFDFEQTHIVGVWFKRYGYKEQSLFRYGLDHLQYLRLNIQERMTEFYHYVWLLICPPESHENSFVV